jgi:hypothetical protein
MFSVIDLTVVTLLYRIMKFKVSILANEIFLLSSKVLFKNSVIWCCSDWSVIEVNYNIMDLNSLLNAIDVLANP